MTTVLPGSVHFGNHRHRATVPQSWSDIILARNSLNGDVQAVADGAERTRQVEVVLDHEYQCLTGLIRRAGTIILRRNAHTKSLVHIGHCAPNSYTTTHKAARSCSKRDEASVPSPTMPLKAGNG
jgi:hypothetical protein